MQSVPDGYEALDFVGFTDRGEFSGTETYIENDIVHKNNTAWRCLKDNTTGVTPEEGENWTIFIASETDSSGITTTDTEGLVGPAGEKASNQDLIDAIADRVINKLLSKSAISTTQINDPEKVPSSSLVFGLGERIGELNENIGNTGNKKVVASGVENLDSVEPFIMIPVANAQGIPDGLKANGAMVLNFSPASNYRAQFAFSFVTDMLAIRRKYGSLDWTEWKYFEAGSASARITATSLCPNNYIIGDQAIYTKNGVCFVWLHVQCIENVPATQERIAFAVLPKPKRSFAGTVQYNGLSSNVTPIAYRLNNDGYLELIGGANTRYYSLNFSYPIEES